MLCICSMLQSCSLYACIMPKNVHPGHRVSTCALYMYSLVSPSICYAHSNYVAREYWMVYRRPGLKAIVWLGSSSTSLPLLSSASCLSFSVFLCIACRAYWRERGGVGQDKIIRRRESLVLFKSFNTVLSVCSSPVVHYALIPSY